MVWDLGEGNCTPYRVFKEENMMENGDGIGNAARWSPAAAQPEWWHSVEAQRVRQLHQALKSAVQLLEMVTALHVSEARVLKDHTQPPSCRDETNEVIGHLQRVLRKTHFFMLAV